MRAGLEYLLPLVLVALASTAVVLGPRRWPGPWTAWAAAALAVTLVVSELGWLAFAASRRLPLSVSLPLQLCDVGAFVAAAALLWRRPLLVELIWFWGLAGTLQSLITPDLDQPFPSFLYLQYYLNHGGIMVAALFLVLGLDLTPRSGSAVRAAALTAAFAALAGIADIVTGGNYLYLRRPPAGPNLLHLLGPWPWYLAAATLIALLLFAALDAPFRIRRR